MSSAFLSGAAPADVGVSDAETPQFLRPLGPLPGAVRVSVVVPLFNETESLWQLYEELAEALHHEPAWEVVFVDDGSTDASYQQLVRLHGAFDNVRVVR